MFLELDNNFKIVFELSQQIKDDPSYMELIQSVTLDSSKPYIGLKGNNGLFGSDIWWNSIKNNVIRTSVIKGRIVRLYSAGQDSYEPNSFDLLLSDGTIWSESIYVNIDSDNDLFKIGSIVCIFYAHDEIKQTIDGDITYSDTVIEMAVSV